MVRWIKLFRDQYLGFWALGLLLFALQEIPYMVMPMLHLETNPIMNMGRMHRIYERIGNGMKRRMTYVRGAQISQTINIVK